MRYILVLLPLALLGCTEYDSGYAYRGSYAPAYASRYYGESAPAYSDRDAYPSRAYSGENCGTPYEWKACPPQHRWWRY